MTDAQGEPIQITTKVTLNDRELATAVNHWNARRLAEASADQAAEINRTQAAIDAAQRIRGYAAPIVRQIAAAGVRAPDPAWELWAAIQADEIDARRSPTRRRRAAFQTLPD